MRIIQKLPASGDDREALRVKGQFWTPPWLAKVMAGWVTQDRPEVLFDPAVGPGTFFAAAREAGFTGEFHGFELHTNAFADGWKLGLKHDDFHHVQIADFISTSLPEKFSAIVSNPPYIRHHRLTQDQKLELKQLAQNHLGFSLDGRVGLHIFFLLKCLTQLAPGGRLAFLLPADVCEGISSSIFWNRICQQYRLIAAMTFADQAAPFPTVDTNAMVFLFTKEKPTEDFLWLRVCERDGEAISAVLDGRKPSSTVNLYHRKLTEALKPDCRVRHAHRIISAYLFPILPESCAELPPAIMISFFSLTNSFACINCRRVFSGEPSEERAIVPATGLRQRI